MIRKTFKNCVPVLVSKNRSQEVNKCVRIWTTEFTCVLYFPVFTFVSASQLWLRWLSWYITLEPQATGLFNYLPINEPVDKTVAAIFFLFVLRINCQTFFFTTAFRDSTPTTESKMFSSALLTIKHNMIVRLEELKRFFIIIRCNPFVNLKLY